MTNQVLKDILTNPKTQATLNSARLLCDLLDSVLTKDYEQENFIDLLHTRLADLYSNSIELPKIELIVDKGEQDLERSKPKPELYSKLSEILGEYTDYSTSFDPTILGDNDNYLQGWLTDDLADIHMDLKEVLANIDKDTDESVQEALWDLKWGLGAHWGHHLIDALRFLHYVRYGHFARHLN